MTTRSKILVVIAAVLAAGICAVVALVWRLSMHAARPAPVVVVVVTVAMAGDVEDNETGVLAPLEMAAGKVEHVASLEGRATTDGALVLVTFDRGVDALAVVADVQREIAGVVRDLPPSAMPPTVARGASEEGARFTVSGNGSFAQMREALDGDVALALETLPGVARVASCGGVDPAVTIEIDGDHLLAAGLDAIAVADAVRAALARSHAVADLSDVVVKEGIRLHDVATVSDGGRAPTCVAFGAEGPRVVGTLAWQPGAQPAEAVRAALAKRDALLPSGVHAVPFDFDATRVRAFVQLVTPATERDLPIVAQRIAKAARVADALDVLVTSPRAPRVGVDLEVEATFPPKVSRARVVGWRRAIARAIEQLPGTTVVTATDDDAPVALHVNGNDLDELRRVADNVRAALASSPGVHGVLVLDARQSLTLEVKPNHVAASDNAVAERDVARVVRLGTVGERIGVLGGARTAKPVWVHVSSLDRAMVRGGGAARIPLAAVTTTSSRGVPETIAHFDRARAVTLWIEGDRRAAQRATQSVALPPGVRLVWGE